MEGRASFSLEPQHGSPDQRLTPETPAVNPYLVLSQNITRHNISSSITCSISSCSDCQPGSKYISIRRDINSLWDILESQWVSSKSIEMKNTKAYCCQMDKNQDKKKFLKSARGKKRCLKDRGISIMMTANLSSETMWGRRQWNDNFQVLGKKAFKLWFYVKKKIHFNKV